MRFIGGQLTRFTAGSPAELLAVSLPLILSVFSMNTLTFVDRLILAKYNLNAMNAAVVAGLTFSVFQYGAIGIAAITEVLVARSNGAKKYDKIGKSVWQMIWFSLMTSAIFWPLGLFAAPFFIPEAEFLKEGVPYFRCLMLFGPVFPLAVTLSSFFIGQGRIKLVLMSTLLSNVLNILLAYFFVFGVAGLGLPALGAKGSALATGLSQLVQAGVLFAIFLNAERCAPAAFKQNNHRFFDFKVFWEAFRLGLPTALASVLELSAWTLLAHMLAAISDAHITIYAIVDAVFALGTVIFWGLQKGVTVVTGNYMGAAKPALVRKCINSGVKLVLGIMFLFTIPFLVKPELCITQFLNPDLSISAMNKEIHDYAVVALRWLWVYCLFDGLSWIFYGVLMAAGDTKFLMKMSSLSVWMFAILPIYIFVYCLDGSPVLTWIIFGGYALVNASNYFLRYKRRPWRRDVAAISMVLS